MLLSHVPSYFKQRRETLLKKAPGSVFLFPASEEVLRNPDVHFPFRQESNFQYLCGFDEPESFLVITPTGSMVLFVRARDVEKEMWEGERYGTEGARKIFGADEAYTIDELPRRLPDLLKGAEKIYYRMGLHTAQDRLVLESMETQRRSLGRSGKSLPPVLDPNEVVGEMRLFKSDEEVALLRRACKITAEAHRTAMREVRPGMNEYEVEAMVDYSFRRQGAQRVGYGSIIAGGKNATCLHYRSNNEPLKDGDLLLIDAGAEFDYYTSDITRTFPVGRRFTDAQAKAYSLVLKIQKQAIAMTRPGVRLPEIHRFVCQSLIDGLLSLGLLKGDSAEIFKMAGHRRFYPHNTSHWLGMDVHDVGLYLKNGEPRVLEPGMCFTIEPGFYSQPGDTAVPAEFQKIGIRIEDDILVTASGCENLTVDAPKEIDEIEALKK
ncbi:MAG: aminopeptidase P N-terminal domain-containing protein [Oligoflexia bacterium]|jgi:Xaa-Pro aminopeptidase